jgi:DNA-binding GntR family transcriptional regulator
MPTLPPGHAGFQTLTSRVYVAIKQEILSGAMPPGTHLTRRALGAQLGVSPIPVIEALHLLERDGLVESEPMYGHRVRLLTVESVRNDHVLREAIECQAARMCAANATESQLKDLARMAQGFDKLLQTGQTGAAYADEHLAFHLAVALMAGCTVLHDTLEKLWFRHLMLINTISATALGVPKQWHTKLVKAIASGDPDIAERAMREHVLFNVDLQLDMIARNRLPGADLPAAAVTKPAPPAGKPKKRKP